MKKPGLYVGVDVSGKGSDFTAVSAVRPNGELIYCARLAHSDFRTQIQQLTPLIDGPRHTPRRIFVDSSGLGIGFLESLRDRCLSPDINGVTITSGSKARKVDDHSYNVSKSYLMECLRRAINTGWLKIKCPGADELRQELENFLHKSNGKLEAGKNHDDLVLSLAIACFGRVAE